MKHLLLTFGIYNMRTDSFLRELGRDIPFMGDDTLEVMRLNCSHEVAVMIDKELSFRNRMLDSDAELTLDRHEPYDDDDYVFDYDGEDFRPYGEDDDLF
jgi:hypothetical protein